MILYEVIFAFVFGAVAGSFLNVLIYRIPLGKSIVFPSSACPACGAKLKPWHNIPIFSWLFLRAKCAFCSKSISAQYPIIELLSALIAVAVVSKMGLSYASAGVVVVFLLLLALSAIDFYYKMVPDSLNLLALTVAIVSVFSFEMLEENFINALLLGGGAALLRFYLSYYLYVKIKRGCINLKKASWTKNYNVIPRYVEAMGEGDIMVIATMGALLGVKLALAAIFLSALIAMPVMLMQRGKSSEEQRVPFVPFLAIATLAVYLFDSKIFYFLESLYA